MLLKAPRLWALLCLLLVLQLATAQSFRVLQRQDDAATVTTESDAEPTNGDDADKTSTGLETSETDAPKSKTESDRKASTTDDSKTSSAAPPASTTITTDGPLDPSSLRNVTIPEGELPITPKITPGWGAAGVLMGVSGVAYSLVGTRNRWIHTFFSTTYLAALGVTVLILYVMSVPVSEALQGGYVAAIVLSGCAVGAGSTFFKELTEGLGCALGGFCVSMWLLCLVPGGLLHPVASKAIFIACFSLVGFAFYFSRWTRDWALIAMISFAGGTVTVLGIDCFSRAGLKEFWAYVWDLNDDLFPYGTETYPVTKGIRVETAAIIIIFLFGIISQIKLWRIVKEQREKRAAERAESQRDLEKEEEDVGRQLEESNARERREWERVHGDGEVGSSMASKGSDLGDARSEKKLINGDHRESAVEVIEMNDLSESGREPERLMVAEDGDDGKVMVRVGADEVLEQAQEDQEDEKASGVTDSTKVVRADIADGKRVSRVSQAPEVVPLPFKVPAEDDARSQGSRSSVATFADDEGLDAAPPAKRRSLVKRLSHNSVTLLRSMSPRSGVAPSEWHGGGESAEDLVSTRSLRQDRDDGSMAATLDDESSSGSERHSVMSPTSAKRFDLNAELSEAKQSVPEAVAALEGAPATKTKQTRPFSTDTVSTGILNEADVAADNASQAPTALHAPESAPESAPRDLAEAPVTEPSEKPPKSATSTLSTPASLTKERLPRSLSKVAMSYRTNEWAKHLSRADAPEPDELHIAETARPTKAEKPAPVMVEELQQTAEPQTLPASAPAPVTATLKRSDSQASHVSVSRTLSRSASKQSAVGGAPEQNTPVRNQPGSGILRSSSSNMALRRSSSNFQPIVEEADAAMAQPPIPEEDRQTDADSISSRIPPPELSHRASGIISYASPQTLLGQRDMFLRSKSQGNLVSPTPDPTPLSPASSDAGSLLNYPMYAAALPVDPDDLPLSQRKQFMRQSSSMSLSGANQNMAQQGMPQRSSTLDSFDSHQPRRVSAHVAPSARESQLANFRQSVAVDLRAGSPMMAVSGRETPFASTTNLLSGGAAEVQRNIELQRNMLLNQKDVDAQRREMQQREKEMANRAFDERMRTGDLLDAHREALRKMQKGARD